ncbi:hypothetical protein KEJ15_04145 [Candidatus Bathyarchaeota archaeon]|nr:hypothetical protein [Candidatus Bathyarchaeota archaeon]
MDFPEEDGRMSLKQRIALKPLAVLLSLVTLTVVASGFIQSSVRIRGQGTVKALGVGVFWNSNCTSPVSFIDWGMVEPGSMNNVTVYVRNEGNVAASISLATENWNPLNASDCLTLSWNYDGKQLNPLEVVQVMLTLTVPVDVHGIKSFSFDIVISISG